jgi:signal transduction histidine kinase
VSIARKMAGVLDGESPTWSFASSGFTSGEEENQEENVVNTSVDRGAYSLQGDAANCVAILAHEVGGHVAAMRNAVLLLRQAGHDPSTRDFATGVLDRQTQQLTRLIENMVELARTNSGTVQLTRGLVNLDEVVNAAIETVRPSLQQRGHRFEVSFPTEPITVKADPTRLEQVMTNLLANAIKFTPPGGRIWLMTEIAPGHVLLRIRDTGVGIAQEMLPYIFDLYRQAPMESGRAAGGLGVGLALVRQFVELHGGTVSAHSEGSGKGSEFVIRLPLASVQMPCLTE